jgi:uncharacterized protein YndB with AHSA1/START domain
MATNRIPIDAPPAAVWSVLEDPGSYAEWVVGASEVRDVEGEWPEPGSTFHHTQGIPKLGLRDTTSVLEVDPLRRLLLRVRLRPLVEADVELQLRPLGRGTEVTMTERPVAWIGGLIHNPLSDLVLHLRNTVALRRLRRLSLERAQAA